MSMLLIWHTLAIVVAPAPRSAITDGAYEVLKPYLTLLGINNGWSFFAPRVENGVVFQYVVTAANGERSIFVPSERLARYHPQRRWVRDRFRGLLAAPGLYADAVGKALCEDHADMKPKSVTLVEVLQKEFLPSDRLAGHSPFEPEFLSRRVVETVSCPGP